MSKKAKPPTEPAGKTILVVDDDPSFLGVVADTLRSKGLEVVTAGDGKEAQTMLGMRDCDLVITDIRMPKMHGIELLHWIKRTKPIPVILMTGFSEITETKEAAELKADGFIPKPFPADDLVRMLETILGPITKSVPKEEAPPLAEEEYSRLRIEDFVSGSQIPYSIYLKLADERYVRIAYKGEDISMERVHAYKAKGVEHLYLRKEDFRDYVGFSLRLARELKKAPQIPKVKKQNFLRLTGELLLDHVFLHGIDDEAVTTARSFVETSISIMVDNDELANLLMILNDHGDFLYAHSVAVSMFSVMIGKQMGWHSSATIFKLAMAGMFHDIGKKEISREVLTKPRAELSREEVSILESHPMRGMAILQAVESVPFDVLQIVLQHHEDCAGTGFPKGLRKGQIHPLARALSVANVFVGFAIKGPHSAGMSAGDALSRLESFHTGLLDVDCVLALKKVLKLD